MRSPHSPPQGQRLELQSNFPASGQTVGVGMPVTVNLRLAGVQASDGVYRTENHQLNFEAGRSQISTIDGDTRRMTIERDGEQFQDFPTSIGRADVEKYTA